MPKISLDTAHQTSRKDPRGSHAGLLAVCCTGLPLIDERFAALVLDDVLHAFAEGVGLALVRRVKAGERGSGLGTADQPKRDQGDDVRAHDAYCLIYRETVWYVGAMVAAAAMRRR